MIRTSTVSLDTMVSAAFPSRTYQDYFVVWCSAGATARAGFVHMNSPAVKGSTIIAAKLRGVSRATTAATTVTARRSPKRVAFSHLTYNNAPAGLATSPGAASVTKAAAPDGTVWEWDVTAHMQHVANGGAWQGWRLDAIAGEVQFRSGAWELEVEWSEAPQQPNGQTPGGGMVISVAKPTLRWDHVDTAGDTTLSAVEVQIHTTATGWTKGSGWTSPTFGSGVVLSSRPELDLSTTSFGGWAAGQTLLWSARNRDGSGSWSLWSEPTEVQREIKGVLTVTSPADGPTPTITDSTPAVLWSLTGRTQAAYQIVVQQYNLLYGFGQGNMWRTVWDSGKITSTATARTIPEGKIGRFDARYRITVRVWDTLDRVPTPGDPARYEVSREVIFDSDGAIAPVATLTADAIGGTPDVELTWTRATAADRWMIVRDGKIIDQTWNAPVTLPGGGYRYIDRTAPGGSEARYQVRPVQNGKGGPSGPSAYATPRLEGLWLSSLDGSLRAHVLDVEWSAEPVEDVEMVTPLGSSRPVKVVRSVGGMAGAVGGRLATNHMDSSSAVDQRAYLEAIKADPVGRFRLSVGDLNVPVVVSNVLIEPRKREDVVDVSFDWHQDGD